ncbi:hypothetical protein [Mycoplasmopsis glycophila]|uniref:Uncharacterized protein n=1 Tax=Mycoplasmopsis glycophila TaxID=171285 RepID=A0A449AWM9_9BACT|nr:hypothetical protein [Mycoplasmopsis glycophila]VEU71147.1 Uncharacterised protein [Mycoplasmopsis glycophila]
MHFSEVKKIFVESLISMVGITKLHRETISVDPTAVHENLEIKLNTNNPNIENDLFSLIDVTNGEKGLIIQIGISILEGVQAKFIISQLNKNLTKNLKKSNYKLEKLIIFIKEVTNE